MTKIEALELELKARKMVDGTELYWWDVIKKINTRTGFKFQPHFDSPHVDYELAFGIIEGKPVWKGDKLFFPSGDQVFVDEYVNLSKATGGVVDLSWNPPASKTVMVELLVADAEHLTHSRGLWSLRINDACRKALGGVK